MLKGKPVVRRGRKASGPGIDVDRKIAGLPVTRASWPYRRHTCYLKAINTPRPGVGSALSEEQA
jgi:hypothetical protein